MQWSILLVLILAMYICIRFSNALIKRYSAQKEVSPYRVQYIIKTFNVVIAVFFGILIIHISGYKYAQISIFLSSIFAVIGVALFAQWSILSNITASLIIFFGFPYRIGDHIKVMDKDDDIHGIIEEITLFHVLIKRDNELITYPNSLILQKGVIKFPKNRQQKQTNNTS